MSQEIETQTVKHTDGDPDGPVRPIATSEWDPISTFADTRPIRWESWKSNGSEHDPQSVPPVLRGIDKEHDVSRSLDQKSVLVAGLGAVGGRAFVQLGRLGVGHLSGVDPDEFDCLSRWTQPCSYRDAACKKATVLGEQAHGANPDALIETGVGYLQDVPLWRLNQADVLVVAGDNLEMLIWAGAVAASLGKVLIQGAVHGETWTAFVRVYDLTDPAKAACPACAMTEQEWPTITTRHGCQPGSLQNQQAVATRTLPNVCSTAAELTATEVFKRLLDHESIGPAAQETTFCLLSHQVFRTAFEKSSRCRCPHRRHDLLAVDQPPSDVTLGDIEGLVASDVGDDSILVRGELPWVSFTFCSLCSRRIPVRRFSWLGQPVGVCCGRPVIASPIGVRDWMPRIDQAACCDVPLSELGLSPGSALTLLCGDDATYAFVGTPSPADYSRGTSLVASTKETD